MSSIATIAARLPAGLLVLMLGGCSSPAATPEQQAAALAAFATVEVVFQRPRSANCHIPGDAPLQGDESVVHVQHVRRGPEGKGVPGLPCATCNGEGNPPNSYGVHAPPGAGRAAVPVPHGQFVAAFRTWVEAGAPCPSPAITMAGP